jgi:hypothetical protein
VVSGASNSPHEQGHGILSVPTTKTAVQRPVAIVREKGGGGCNVVLILVEEEEEEEEEEEGRSYVEKV